jgi:hypothetical protein
MVTAPCCRWEQENPEKDPSKDEHILAVVAEIKIVQDNIAANTRYKEQLQRTIQELNQTAKQLQHEFPNRITRQERRQLLQTMIDSQALELEKMELEVQLKIRDKIILDQQRVLKGKDRK